MFLLKHLRFFKRNYKTAAFFNILQFQWNPSLNQMELRENHESIKRSTRLGLKLHIIYTLILIVQAGALPNDYASLGFLMAMVSLIFNIGCHAYLRVCTEQAADIILYINGMFKIASRLDKIGHMTHDMENSRLIEKMNIGVAECVWYSCLTTGLFIAIGLQWREPCGASLAGYWILPECGMMFRQNSDIFGILGKLAKLFLISWNCWLTTFVCVAAGFLFGNVQVLCTLTLRELLIR